MYAVSNRWDDTERRQDLERIRSRATPPAPIGSVPDRLKIWGVIDRLGRSNLHEMRRTHRMTDRERFARDYPELAAELDETPKPTVADAFDLGRIFYPKQHDHVDMCSPWWEQWLEPHLERVAEIRDGWLESRFKINDDDNQRWPPRRFSQYSPGEYPTRFVIVQTAVRLATLLQLWEDWGQPIPAAPPPETRRPAMHASPFSVNGQPAEPFPRGAAWRGGAAPFSHR